MDRLEAFKFGFLYRCAEEGLDKAASDGRARLALALCKSAEDGKVSNPLAGVVDAGKSVLQLGSVPLLASALVGGIGGIGAGYVAGKAQDTDVDTAEIQRQEQIAAYNLFADRALEKTRSLRRARAARPTSRYPR